MGSKLTGPASLSCVLTSLSPTNPTRYSPVHPYHFRCALLMSKGTSPIRKKVVHVVSEAQSEVNELGLDPLELEDHQQTAEAPFTATNFTYQLQGTDGKPGFISFYNRPYKLEDKVPMSMVQRKYGNLLCFAGPAILLASFVFPSLYLRRILSAIFEDSLLTDFLILFFTEALFYCGVGLFLLIIDYLKRPVEPESSTSIDQTLAPNLIQQISSIATLVLSLIVPMFTMGFVWPWIGPAASATLAPYLVGIIVQFAFERYARYRKSPSWAVIPIIFQVYRLHQLNRAAQLVTALSFTVRGAEMTSHNLEIGNSLGTLLNVLQFLGVLCIWSLSSFLMKFFPSSTGISERS